MGESSRRRCGVPGLLEAWGFRSPAPGRTRVGNPAPPGPALATMIMAGGVRRNCYMAFARNSCRRSTPFWGETSPPRRRLPEPLGAYTEYGLAKPVTETMVSDPFAYLSAGRASKSRKTRRAIAGAALHPPRRRYAPRRFAGSPGLRDLSACGGRPGWGTPCWPRGGCIAAFSRGTKCDPCPFRDSPVEVVPHGKQVRCRDARTRPGRRAAGTKCGRAVRRRAREPGCARPALGRDRADHAAGRLVRWKRGGGSAGAAGG